MPAPTVSAIVFFTFAAGHSVMTVYCSRGAVSMAVVLLASS